MSIPEGICIRKIPKEITSYYYTSKEGLLSHKRAGGRTCIKPDGREVIIRTKKPEHGGKYIATDAYHNNSTVTFHLPSCGIGDTIEEAISNLKG